MIECQTDSKNRTLSELKYLLKEIGGSSGSVSHLFERRGKLVFGKAQTVDDSDMFDKILDVSGTIDVDLEESEAVTVLTKAEKTAAAAEKILQIPGLELFSSDIVWNPNAHLTVNITQSEPLNELLGMLEKLGLPNITKTFVDRLHEHADVQAVYCNASYAN